MKKITKDLIEFDFFLTNENKKNIFISLNISVLNKSLKQFIRLIKHTRRITILCNDEFLLGILEYFIEKQNLKNKIFVISDIYDLKKYSALLIISTSNLLSARVVNRSILSKNVFLINVFRLEHNLIQEGVYNVRNSILDYKKVFIILIIIERILKG